MKNALKSGGYQCLDEEVRERGRSVNLSFRENENDNKGNCRGYNSVKIAIFTLYPRKIQIWILKFTPGKLEEASVTILADFGPEFNPPFRWGSKHQTKNHRAYH